MNKENFWEKFKKGAIELSKNFDKATIAAGAGIMVMSASIGFVPGWLLGAEMIIVSGLTLGIAEATQSIKERRGSLASKPTTYKISRNFQTSSA